MAISGGILGTIALREGDLKEARQRLDEALRIHEEVEGPDTPNVAATRHAPISCGRWRSPGR